VRATGKSKSLVEKVADAVLYEGYILYPYRPSAVKNQQRWNFGALCPQSYSLAQGGTEAWTMQTECIAQVSSGTTLDLKVRFLQLLTREVGVPTSAGGFRASDFAGGQSATLPPDSDYRVVGSLKVNGQLFQTWQEAVERVESFTGIKLSGSTSHWQRLAFSFPASEQKEPLRDENSGEIVGVIVRRQQEIEGAIEVVVQRIGKEIVKLTIRILNLTPLADAGQRSRDDALLRSLVSTHTILNVREGEFVSLLDPPEAFLAAVGSCNNVGTFPVLVGAEGERDCLLSSPIILYDYPQIAAESAGDLFDSTEIDEILTLRIMTLTEEEKIEMRGADDRARQILERTETLPLEQLMKLHGAMKGVNQK
jgi:hydrogenase maturation protease